MFNVAEHPYRYHFDVRSSLITDLQLSQHVCFVPGSDVHDYQFSECYVCREIIALPVVLGIDL